MTELTASSLLLGGFLLMLLLLAWLSRQISLHVQWPISALTRSQDASTLAVFLIFLPGVIVHEAAHWSMARLLGLHTGKFRVWPQRQGQQIGLGSVHVESKGPLLDSLVGMAPLVAGSGLITFIATRIFNAGQVAVPLAEGRVWDALNAFMHALREPDGMLWAYLLFTIANAMMPSASDREPVKPVLLYGAAAIALYVLLGMPLQGIATVMLWLVPTLQLLTSALIFTVVLDLVILFGLYFLRLLIAR